MMTCPNYLTTAIGAATFALAFAFASSGFGQQQGGMSPQDMQQIMAECAHSRQQFQEQMQQNPGMTLSGEMQQVMAQCDQIDRMHGQAGGSPGQQAPQQAPSHY